MSEDEIVVSVVLPAYNEEQAIGGVLDGLIAAIAPLGLPYEIIVVDDGSTDRTAALCEARTDVQVIRHPHNRGTGAARTTGVRAARGNIIVMTDADGTYGTEPIPAMIAALGHCDMVIGARDKEMGTVAWLRSLAKNAIKALASYLTRTHIPDLNSGLRVMRRDRVLEFARILPSTHSWVSTITMAMLSSGYLVEWMPVQYHKRIGRSSFRPVTDTYNYLSLVVRAIMYFDPLRVFLPVTMALFLVGSIKALYDIVAYHFHFAPSTVVLLLSAVQIGAIGLLADLIVRRSKL
jgi:glycosyltransferase involved in cell wall biosynthesis